MATDVLIVGGGLAGLNLAAGLADRGVDFVLVEARPRLGGRMRTHSDPRGGRFDLGPAWLWPHQPRLQALAARLGIPVFDQHVVGKTVFQDARGQVRRDLDLAPMAGSLRLDGGYGRLIDALAEPLPADRIRLDAPVRRLERTDDGVTVHLEGGRLCVGRRVVFAMPPRLVAALPFDPTVPDEVARRLRTTPTWMATSAKLLAIYDTPFWRARGLSGEGLSHRGPLVEVHDASSADGTSAALFGFFGVPPHARRDHPAAVRDLALQQLVAMVGPEAARPLEVVVADWADEPFTTTDLDRAEASRPVHPDPAPIPPLGKAWTGVLHFAGSEFAWDEPGYAEGALQASETVLEELQRN